MCVPNPKLLIPEVLAVVHVGFVVTKRQGSEMKWGLSLTSSRGLTNSRFSILNSHPRGLRQCRCLLGWELGIEN